MILFSHSRATLSCASLAMLGALTVGAIPLFAHPIDQKGYDQLKSETKYFSHATSGQAALNQPVPNFTIKTLSEKTLSKASFKNKMALFVMADTDCPCVQAVEVRLKTLAKKYGNQGLSIVYIFPMPEQRPAQIARFMQNHQIPFPAVFDQSQRFTKMVNGQCLSEVYLMDKKGILRYHGRVDDSTFDPKAVKSRDLENAIMAIAANKHVPKAFAPALGCAIPRS